MTNKFYSLSNLPNVIPSPAGEEVYTWLYKDQDGEIKTGEKNVYQEIQSQLPKCDYKRKIKEGSFDEFDNSRGLYMDTTKYDGGYSSVNDYLAGLVDTLREELAKTNVPQENAGANSPTETQQTAGQGGETPKEVNQNGGNE